MLRLIRKGPQAVQPATTGTPARCPPLLKVICRRSPANGYRIIGDLVRDYRFATLMYIVMDGFDLGIGILFGTVRGSTERDVMVNSVAPVWDGNETRLVLGGAGLFGAFPLAYAVIIDALSIP